MLELQSIEVVCRFNLPMGFNLTKKFLTKLESLSKNAGDFANRDKVKT